MSSDPVEHDREGGSTGVTSSEALDREKVEVDAAAGKKDGEAEVPAMSKGKISLIMTALSLAVFLAAIDMTIITTALPTIAADFNASEGDYTWVGSAYLLAAAAGVPTWGKVSDIFGRKPILLVANVIFFVGSLICALSTNVKMLLAGRVLQGVGGGGLLTLANICIGDMFSVRERPIYFSVLGMVWALACALGPVIGGAFTEYVTWRWNFWINLPLDGIAFAVLAFFLNIHNPKTPLLTGLRAIDWIGTLLVVGGTVTFLLGLNYGGVNHPWSSATVICLIIFGLVMLALFVTWEWNFAKFPIMPPRIFHSRSNSGALAVCFVHGFVYIADAYFLPQYFQIVLGASPLLSGVYLFPFIITLSFASIATGIYTRSTGKVIPAIWFGMLFLILGHGLYIDLQPYASWARIILFQILVGLGVGPNFQAPLIALSSGVEPRDMAAATATFGFARHLANAVSVVIGGVIFQNQINAKRATLEAALPAALVARLSGGDAGSASNLVTSLPVEQQAVVRAVYTKSLQTLWIFYTCFAVLGLLAVMLIRSRVLSTTHEAAKTGLPQEENARDGGERKERAGDLESD